MFREGYYVDWLYEGQHEIREGYCVNWLYEEQHGFRGDILCELVIRGTAWV